MKDCLSIGEMSALFNLNVQTLHYYESIDLLIPDSKKHSNGYRYYSFGQIYRLATIRYLKKLGYSLKAIKSFLDSRDTEHSLSNLKAQSFEIEKKLDDLQQINAAIQRRIAFVEHKISTTSFTGIYAKDYPVRYYVPIGDENNLYQNDNYYFFPTVVFYKQNKKMKFGASIEIPREKLSVKHICTIPEGTYLCSCHNGPYNTIQETISDIRAYAKANTLTLNNNSVHFNIIDQFFEKNDAKFVTEIQILVAEGDIPESIRGNL